MRTGFENKKQMSEQRTDRTDIGSKLQGVKNKQTLLVATGAENKPRLDVTFRWSDRLRDRGRFGLSWCFSRLLLDCRDWSYKNVSGIKTLAKIWSANINRQRNKTHNRKELCVDKSQQKRHEGGKQKNLPLAGTTSSTGGFTLGGDGLRSSAGGTWEHKTPQVKTNQTKDTEVTLH